MPRGFECVVGVEMTKLISSGWVVQPSVIWMLMVVVNRQIYGGFDSCVISVWLLGK